MKYIIAIIINTAFLSGILFSCKQVNYDNSLEKYVSAIKDSTFPGAYAMNYIQQYNHLSPDKKMSQVYIDLLDKWIYIDDDINNDYIKDANRIIKENKFEGDCDDFAAVLLTLCRAINIECRICLGEHKTFKTGHMWTEIILCKEEDYDLNLQRVINDSFEENVTIYSKDSTVYIALISKDDFKNYEITHYVNFRGNLF